LTVPNQLGNGGKDLHKAIVEFGADAGYRQVPTQVFDDCLEHCLGVDNPGASLSRDRNRISFFAALISDSHFHFNCSLRFVVDLLTNTDESGYGVKQPAAT